MRSGAVERSLPITSSATFTPSRLGHPMNLFDAPDRRLAIVVVRRGLLRVRHTEVHDEEREWDDACDVQRGFHLAQRRLSRIGVAKRGGEVALAPAVRKYVGDGRVDGMQVEPGLGQPLLQRIQSRPRRDSRSGFAWRTLRRVESVRRNLEQVRLLQPLFVIQVSRDAKLFHDALYITDASSSRNRAKRGYRSRFMRT